MSMTTIFLLAMMQMTAPASDVGKTSKTITSVLREPLPPENLSCSTNDRQIIVEGPTFTYSVDRATGAVSSLQVRRDEQVVIELKEAADIQIDDYSLAANKTAGKTEVVSRNKQKVVLKTEGVLKDPKGQGPDIGYTLVHTFYNDGVVVSELKLLPTKDLLIRKAISYRVPVTGAFSHYIHKRRNSHGMGSRQGHLPEVGKSARLTTLTSCLQVFSPEAALAIFTDGGAIHVSKKGLDTAVVEVKENKDGRASLSLTQYMVNIGAGEKGYLLKANTEFTFRVGMSIAPNRLPHPRRRDLRQFAWIGDGKHPYPTDKEIFDVAQLGFTLFQMHRLGILSEPRPPAGELERVIKKVHEAGMLFIWASGADLIHANTKGVVDLQARGKWPLWQGFNYGGKYKAKMDPYCDYVAVCLAAPNGLAEYRLAMIKRMMEKYEVDGMYIDDNLGYANCRLWKEHGHPRKVYDCLIELHEMNWARRQLLRKHCPHMVLIDHCTSALFLPVICDFDVHLYGEGYGFSSLKGYWDFFGSIKNMYAQGFICPGDTEKSRCAANVAYNYGLLGGGQYCYSDWRLYPQKFPYAAGVAKHEPLFIKTYNLAQYYFGMYESTPYYFATSGDVFSTTAPGSYATVYRNRVWGDYLIPIANMAGDTQKTSLQIHSLQKLGISPDAEYVLYDVNERTSSRFKGDMLKKGISDIPVPGKGLKLFYLRQRPADTPYHLWGGKRVSEVWDGKARKLTLKVHGPVGLEDTVFIAVGSKGIKDVKINGKTSEFFFDPSRAVAHGKVTFGPKPVQLEAACSEDGLTNLPNKAITPDKLTMEYLRKREKP